MPSKKKLRRHIKELEDRIIHLESELYEERTELRTYNRLLTQVRAALSGRVPNGEIGITFSGWVAKATQLIEKYVPIRSSSGTDGRISVMVKLVEELKVEAIAEGSFDRAAHLRDVADRLLYVSEVRIKELANEKV